MKKIKSALILLAVVLSSASMNSWADTAKSWNLAKDMIFAKEASPPNFPWAFMQNASGTQLAANYTLLPNFVADTCNGLPATCWLVGSGAPYVAVYKQAYTFSGSGGSFVFPQGDVALQPGANSQTIVRWRSPVVGNIKVLGRINHLHAACGNGVAWSLMLGDTVLQSGNLARGGSGVFSVSDVAVDATSSIYFVLDSKGDYSCDSSGMELLITNTP